ncbi:hypothetical protein ACE6H2_004745 [Prunus campanulata]
MIFAQLVIKLICKPLSQIQGFNSWPPIVSREQEKVPPEPGNDERANNFYDGEILDKMTRSRDVKPRTRPESWGAVILCISGLDFQDQSCGSLQHIPLITVMLSLHPS